MVDRFGVTQVLLRDRYAGAFAITTATGKAWTAVNFRNNTGDVVATTPPDTGVLALPGATVSTGGVMVEAGGTLVGAILGAILVNYNLSQFDNAWVAGVLCLGLNYAAYEAEVFRAGFLSVERGQTEAALSLGLSGGQNFWRIVFPQAIPLMAPPFVNDFIYMLKDSAILSVIAGTELTSVMQRAAFLNSSNTVPLYVLGLLLYLTMSLPVSLIARFFERRLRAAL